MSEPQFDPDPHEAEFPPEDPAVTEASDEELDDAARVDPDFETQPGDDLEAEPVADPDLEAALESGSSERPDVLKTEELRPEEELEEPDPAPEPSLETRVGRTPSEAREGETLEDRIEQEEPER